MTTRTTHLGPLVRSLIVLLAVALLTVAIHPAIAAAATPAQPTQAQAEATYPPVEDAIVEDTTADGPDSPAAEPPPKSAEVPDAPVAGRPLSPVSNPTAAIDSVEGAVAANRLDPALVSAVDNDGPQTALVLFVDSRSRAAANLPKSVKVVEELEHLSVLVARVTSTEDLLALAQIPGVDHVGISHTGEAATSQSLSIIRQPQAAASGARGSGSVVVVMDTGLNHNRSEFGNCSSGPGTSSCKVLKNLEIAPQDGHLDDNGHGTNVSAIVLKVAPAAKVIHYDVFAGPYWYESYLVTAINHAIGLKKSGTNIVAINMSLGKGGVFSNNGCSTYPTLNATLQKAYDAGILPISAAGNDAYATGSFRSGITAPACSSYSMAIGATYDYAGTYGGATCTDSAANVDRVTCFSQTGTGLSMLAPGSRITAGGYAMSGTSQASPHVAGAAAVLAGENRSAGPAAIWNALTKTGKAIVDHRGGPTRNRLDLPAAIAQVGGGADTSAPTVSVKPPRLKTGSTARTTGEVPVKIDWTASDASGISKYVVFVSIRGGSWQELNLASNKSEGTWMLTPNTNYRFAVRAIDKAGNASAYKYTSTFNAGSYNEKNTSVKRSTGWQFFNNSASYGGRYAYSETKGAWTKLTFSGRSVAVLAPKWASGKSIDLYIDGKYVKNVSLRQSSTTHRKVVFSYFWSAKGTHTIKLVVRGATGGPSAGFDGFVVLR